MRLNQQETDQIVKAIASFLVEQSAELRLFGSRANDQLKGGDIDLLLLLASQEQASQLQAQKHRILAKIKSLIGEQKIDLKIAYKDQISTDAFLALIYPESVLLHQW